MKQTSIFRGAATALVTPLTPDGIDFAQFRRLIDWQIGEGIDALVIAGTTGEGSTLTDAEHREAIRFSVEVAAGRVPIIAGTGSNDTDYAIDLTRYACSVGADAMLVVTPYYNKATQKGLIRMYSAIADASEKPLILYNVPSRTGVGIEPTTYLALADHPQIAAIKEANGNISKIVETRALVGDRLDIYSGNDDEIVPILAAGGAGVISVLSNLLPRQTSELCKRYPRLCKPSPHRSTDTVAILSAMEIRMLTAAPFSGNTALRYRRCIDVITAFLPMLCTSRCDISLLLTHLASTQIRLFLSRYSGQSIPATPSNSSSKLSALKLSSSRLTLSALRSHTHARAAPSMSEVNITLLFRHITSEKPSERSSSATTPSSANAADAINFICFSCPA